MLTYMALDWDHQSYRAAKLKALQAFYGTTEAKPFAMLAADAMSPANKDRGPDLVINSHGNAQVFGGYDPAAFLTQLQGKGFFQVAMPDGSIVTRRPGEVHIRRP